MNVRDKARPWFKFWAADWRNDTKLQQCTLEQKGFLIELMSIAHDCEPYGKLMANGRPLTPEMIARSVRVDPRTARRLLIDLLEMDRIAEDVEGEFSIPRMVKDGEKYSKGVIYGGLGGNPTLNPKTRKGLTPEADTEADTDTEPPTPRQGNGVSPEAIYQAYPKHVQKQAAIKAISKAIKSGRGGSFLLERVQAYAKATSDQDRQYIPYPASWFNSGRYDDDPSEWVRKNDSQAKAVLDMNDLMGSTQDKIDRGKRLLEEGDRKREKVRLERANIAKSD